jgi:transcriptional regulator with XRE-family HTH domain
MKNAEMAKRIRQVIDVFESGKNQMLAQKTGASSGLVTNWLTGRNKPGASYRIKICQVYGVSRDWLDDGTGPMVLEERGKSTDPPHTMVLPTQGQVMLSGASKSSDYYKGRLDVLEELLHGELQEILEKLKELDSKLTTVA